MLICGGMATSGRVYVRAAGGCVLDELEQLAAVHHLAGRHRDVPADREGPGVDHRRHAAVVDEVVTEVPQAGDEALAPRLPRLRQRAGVAEQRVGGSRRLGDERHREARPLAALVVEADVVDQPEQGIALDEVRLHDAAVDGVVGPGRVGEALVRRHRGQIAVPHGHVHQPASGVDRVVDDDSRLDGHPAEQPPEGGADLAAGEADEGVGAEDRRVVSVERSGVHRRSDRDSGEQLPQVLLRELAHRRLRDAVEEDDVVGEPPLRHPGLEVGEQIGRRVLGGAHPGTEDDARDRPLAPPGVGHADDGRLGDLRVGHQLVLELDRADPLAARLDDVLGPVDQADVPVRVDGGDVAGPEPPVGGERLGRARVVVVAGGDPRAPDLQLAGGAAVPRQRSSGVVGVRPAEARLHADGRLAHARAQVGAALLVEVARQGRLEVAQRTDRAGLGHAPRLQDRQPGGGPVGLGQGLGHRRAAADHHAQAARVAARELGEHPHPDGGHPGRHGDPLRLDEVGHRRGRQVRPGHDQRRARGHRRVGEAPGVGVEHRDDRQDPVGLVDRPWCRPPSPRGCGGTRSGGCRRPPWGCPWCRSCSTSTRRATRRRPGTRPARRRRAGSRSRAPPARRRRAGPRPRRRPSRPRA